MDRGNKTISLSNSLQNLLFPPGKYSAAQLVNLTPFFHGTLTLDKYKQLMMKTFETPNEQRLWWVIKAEYGQVDAKVLLVVLMLQLIGKQKRELGGYNQASKNIPANSSGSHHSLNSPRNKPNRSLYISNEQILIQNFIKQNLVMFLKLLPNEPPNTEDPFLTPQELQPLSILFKVERTKQFSSYLPIFSNAQKLKASTISEHLAPRIVISEQQMLSLEGLSFSVTIKQELQCRGKDLKIIGCYDSEIFIESPVKSLYIVGCGSCNIYVAACQRIAFVDKCEKISLTVASNLLRVCNTMDSSIYSYSPSPIILTGDNRTLSLAPNNSASRELRTHIKAANIPVSKQYINQFENVICRAQNNTFQIMKPVDFDVLVLPNKNEEQVTRQANNNGLLLAPQRYVKELEERNAYYQSFKNTITKSNLNPEMTKHLHSAYQGYFKDWLISKGYNKNLIDLVKMIDRR